MIKTESRVEQGVIEGKDISAAVEALAPIVSGWPLQLTMLAISHLMHDLHFFPKMKEAMKDGAKGMSEIPAGIGGSFPLNDWCKATFEIGLDKEKVEAAARRLAKLTKVQELLATEAGKDCDGHCGGTCTKH